MLQRPFFLPTIQMEQHVFLLFSLIKEGTTEKVLQFIMPLRSIYNQNLGFIEQNCIFEHLQRGSNNKESINSHYFCHENIFLVTFSELPLQAYVSITQRCTVPLRKYNEIVDYALQHSHPSISGSVVKCSTTALPPLALTILANSKSFQKVFLRKNFCFVILLLF